MAVRTVFPLEVCVPSRLHQHSLFVFLAMVTLTEVGDARVVVLMSGASRTSRRSLAICVSSLEKCHVVPSSTFHWDCLLSWCSTFSIPYVSCVSILCTNLRTFSLFCRPSPNSLLVSLEGQKLHSLLNPCAYFCFCLLCLRSPTSWFTRCQQVLSLCFLVVISLPGFTLRSRST